MYNLFIIISIFYDKNSSSICLYSYIHIIKNSSSMINDYLHSSHHGIKIMGIVNFVKFN